MSSPTVELLEYLILIFDSLIPGLISVSTQDVPPAFGFYGGSMKQNERVWESTGLSSCRKRFNGEVEEFRLSAVACLAFVCIGMKMTKLSVHRDEDDFKLSVHRDEDDFKLSVLQSYTFLS